MNSSTFPKKKIGILFLEKLESDNFNPKNKSPRSKDLNFDQVACSHLILQMNYHQNLFDFQIVTLFKKDKEFTFLNDNHKKDITLDIFDTEISRVEQKAFQEKKKTDEKISNEYKEYKKYNNIDYWIGITSKKITFIDNKTKVTHTDHFFRTLKEKQKSKKILGLITTHDWDREFSPPSLFEYIVYTVFTCGLYFLNYDYGGSLSPHKDKGCIFDFTYYRTNKRISISNPNICVECKNKVLSLEECVDINSNNKSNLSDNVNLILDRSWMGSLEKRDTPLFNLKKNYGYDVDRNSGFIKGQLEKFRDKIFDNLPNWIGLIVTSLMTTTILVLVGLETID